jgi:hypothetical protein
VSFFEDAQCNFVKKRVSSAKNEKRATQNYNPIIFIHTMRTGNPPVELEVLLIFRVLRAGYWVCPAPTGCGF